MNRRNFFGTIGAAVAGLVLGGNVKPTETLVVTDVNWGFAAGDDLLIKPGSITFDSSNGLRLITADDLYAEVFIADETRVGEPLYWTGNHRFGNRAQGAPGVTTPQDSSGDAVLDWYGPWL